jgi:hypothetical protein
MFDCQIYGLNPAGYHLTNLFSHLASALLLFGVLHRMTRALGRSALVATLFSVHPLHVESVAWVAERKNVLSIFFWMLTMWAYVRYAETRRLRSLRRHQQRPHIHFEKDHPHPLPEVRQNILSSSIVWFMITSRSRAELT